MIKLIALASALCLCLGLTACGGSDGGLWKLTYELLEDGSGYAITGFDIHTSFGKAPEEVRFPDTYEGLPVTALHASHLSSTTPATVYEVQRYIIPSSITYIASGALAFNTLGNSGYEPDHDLEFVFESPENVRIHLFRQFLNITHTSVLKLPAFTILASDDIEDRNSYVLDNCPSLKALDLSACKFETKDVELNQCIGNEIVHEISQHTDNYSIVLPGGYQYKDVMANTKISFFVAGTPEDTGWTWDSWYYDYLSNPNLPKRDIPDLYFYSETAPESTQSEYEYWHYVDGVPTKW